jgi:hypothetical protein
VPASGPYSTPSSASTIPRSRCRTIASHEQRGPQGVRPRSTSMRLKRSLRRLTVASCLLLGVGTGAGLWAGPGGFRHHHKTDSQLNTHVHSHSGPHRHDTERLQDHDHPHRHAADHGQGSTFDSSPGLPQPEPERNHDGPEGQYVAAIGSAIAPGIGAVARIGPPESAGPIVHLTDSVPSCQSVDLGASPRGPPA